MNCLLILEKLQVCTGTYDARPSTASLREKKTFPRPPVLDIHKGIRMELGVIGGPLAASVAPLQGSTFKPQETVMQRCASNGPMARCLLT